MGKGYQDQPSELKNDPETSWICSGTGAKHTAMKYLINHTLSILTSIFLAVCLTGCSTDTEPKTEPGKTEVPAMTAEPAETADTLVVYFSATGNTRSAAEKIALITSADLYEITAEEPYTSDDLNYNDHSSRTSIEQNDKSIRPGISSEDIDLTGYKTVFIGFPIWWGEEPRIMDTFAENHDFEGITVIPFCTSASSGIGRSGTNMAELADSGTWLEGRRFDGAVTEEELSSWIEGIK